MCDEKSLEKILIINQLLIMFLRLNLTNDAIAKKGKENIINATIGSLYDEDGNYSCIRYRI